jgi:hypothetical protein
MWRLFTYLSGSLTIAVLLMSTLAVWKDKEWRLVDYLRGMVTLYMVVVGGVSMVLLSSLYDLTTMSIVMHVMIPLSVIVIWVLHPPRKPFGFVAVMGWFMLLVAYLIFAIWYGTVTEEPIYPFLEGGIRESRVRLTLAVIFCFTIIAAFLVNFVANVASKRAYRHVSPA